MPIDYARERTLNETADMYGYDLTNPDDKAEFFSWFGQEIDTFDLTGGGQK